MAPTPTRYGGTPYALTLDEVETARLRRMASRARRTEATLWKRAGFVSGARVADVGCGPGAVLRLLAGPRASAAARTLGGRHAGEAMTAPVCVCCAWPMGALGVATSGRDGYCFVCETAGCTAAVIGSGVERPEVHRRPVPDMRT